jgi:DNA gyrase/topoisomerase IV subunit B
VEKANKKSKNANVKPFMVKNHLWVFINCQIENPAFDSQVLTSCAGGRVLWFSRDM